MCFHLSTYLYLQLFSYIVKILEPSSHFIENSALFGKANF
jgi:hypothetical protein